MTEAKPTIYDSVCPTDLLDGAYIPTAEARSGLNGGCSEEEFALAMASTSAEHRKFIACKQASAIFARCFRPEFPVLRKRYAELGLHLFSDEDWLLLAKHVRSDLIDIATQFRSDPEERAAIERTILLDDEKTLKKSVRLKRYGGSRNRQDYENYLANSVTDEHIAEFFDVGINGGVAVAVAYYELGQQFTSDGSYDLSLLKPLQRLLFAHSGLSAKSEPDLKRKAEREDIADDDAFLFNPEYFEVARDEHGRKAVRLRNTNFNKDNQAHPGCPAFGNGVIREISRLIEGVVTTSHQATTEIPAACPSKFLLEHVPPQYREEYLRGYGGFAIKQST